MQSKLFTILFLLLATGAARAEDGHDLWLRYLPVAAPGSYRNTATAIVADGRSLTLAAAAAELTRGRDGLLAQPTPIAETATDGAIVIGTPQASSLVAELKPDLSKAGNEGFAIRSARIGGHAVTV